MKQAVAIVEIEGQSYKTTFNITEASHGPGPNYTNMQIALMAVESLARKMRQELDSSPDESGVMLLRET